MKIHIILRKDADVPRALLMISLVTKMKGLNEARALDLGIVTGDAPLTSVLFKQLRSLQDVQDVTLDQKLFSQSRVPAANSTA